VESTGRVVHAYEFVCAEHAQKACIESLAAEREQRDEAVQALATSHKEDAVLEKRLVETLALKQSENSGKLRAREAAEQDLAKQLIRLNAEHSQLRKACETDTAASHANDVAVTKINSLLAQAQSDLDSAKVATSKATETAATAAAAAAQKQSQYEAAIGLGASSRDGAKSLQAQLSDASCVVSARETELKTAEMRKRRATEGVKETEKKLAEARSRGGKGEKEHALLSAEVAGLLAQIECMHDMEDAGGALRRQLQEKQKAGSILGRQERDLASHVTGVDFKYSDPQTNFDRRRVKGTVASNMRVRDAAHSTALEALAGGRLYHVLVDDEATGMQLLTKGGLQRRITLIPLSSIRPQVLAADRVAAAKKLVGASKVFLAVDLLEFEADVASAMHYVFGTALVCNDKDAARNVCDRLGLKTVTLEGDLYDPSGTLTGGSRHATDTSVLHRLGLLCDLRMRLKAHAEEVAGLTVRVDEARKQSEVAAQLQSAIELKQHELNICAETMRSSPVGLLCASVKSLQQQLAEAEAAAMAAKSALAAATERKSTLASQVKDFEGNREERMSQVMGAIAGAKKDARCGEKALQAARATEEKAALLLEELDKELSVAAEQREELARRHAQTVAAMEEIATAEQTKRHEYEAAAAELAKCLQAVGDYNAVASEIIAQREQLENLCADRQIQLNKIEHRCTRYQTELSAAEAACRELLRRHPWMEAERYQFNNPGTEYDFDKRRPSALQKELVSKTARLEALSKRVNKKVSRPSCGSPTLAVRTC
jgi:structural maintenance of chromosome 2